MKEIEQTYVQVLPKEYIELKDYINRQTFINNPPTIEGFLLPIVDGLFYEIVYSYEYLCWNINFFKLK